MVSRTEGKQGSMLLAYSRLVLFIWFLSLVLLLCLLTLDPCDGLCFETTFVRFVHISRDNTLFGDLAIIMIHIKLYFSSCFLPHL